MSKEKRFEQFGDICIKDNKEQHLYNLYQCNVILNQQDQQISELKQQLAQKNEAIENWETMYKSVVQTCHNDAKEIDRLNKLLAEKEKEITRLKKNWGNSKTQQRRLYDNLKQEFEMWKNTPLILEENKAVEYLDSLTKFKVIDLFVNHLITHNQDKISFAVEHINKLKNDLYDNEKINIRACDFDEIDNIFDNQIKQLKEMK